MPMISRVSWFTKIYAQWICHRLLFIHRTVNARQIKLHRVLTVTSRKKCNLLALSILKLKLVNQIAEG